MKLSLLGGDGLEMVLYAIIMILIIVFIFLAGMIFGIWLNKR